ncbi:hypothetical protein P691DRAFT_803524 [Macrolepiota fuliginosa MF-IS2]|uniref:YhhN-like protein n=1 Tax=Macrolepiota fuliginosa MF-IS2 TaxID=1400762 RepID=A0A9P6C2J9_9AGAR|nr:hypothetical protein P691DRAFT_803524 [Macrolepiota fuliginosa MF-IS2]
MNSLQSWISTNIRLPAPPYAFLLSTSLGLLITSEATNFYPGSVLFKVCASLSFVSAGLRLLEDDWHNPLGSFISYLGTSHTTHYSLAIVLGLGFSLMGDIFLIPTAATYYNTAKSPEKKDREESSSQHEAATVRFKLGIFFFALAHVAYIFAFLSSATSRGPLSFLETILDPARFRHTHFILSFTFGLLLAHHLGLLRKPELGSLNSIMLVPDGLLPLVRTYIGIIVTMVSVASATDNGWQKIVGAWMFMVSDLFVAMDVFGTKKDAHRGGLGRQGWKSRSVGLAVYFWAQMILAGTV